MSNRHAWYGPFPALPAAEILDEMEAKDGLRLVTVVPVPMQVGQDAAGQALVAQGFMVLMRQDARVVVPAAAVLPRKH